jgi:hypothetical protein
MTMEEQVHHPDMKKPQENGLMCWLNMDRPCGPDCMAFADPPLAKGADYEDKQWANCILLVGVHQASKHVAVLAQHLVRAARTPPPPKVGT